MHSIGSKKMKGVFGSTRKTLKKSNLEEMQAFNLEKRPTTKETYIEDYGVKIDMPSKR